MHVAIRVDDARAAYEALGRRGMSFQVVPSTGPTGNTAVYGRDPFGNIIGIIRRATSL